MRAKCKPILDSQEFKQIFDKESGEEGKSLRDVMSTFEKEMQINQAVLQQAEADAPKSGYDTEQFFVMPTDKDGNVNIIDASDTEPDASSSTRVSATLRTPSKNYYIAYGGGDGIPANGSPYTFGTSFPSSADKGAYHLRTDYYPNRLFRYDGNHWLKVEDGARMSLTNTHQNNPITNFVNEDDTRVENGETKNVRTALSKALKPEADN